MEAFTKEVELELDPEHVKWTKDMGWRVGKFHGPKHGGTNANGFSWHLCSMSLLEWESPMEQVLGGW
jgi:hypothetical protein